MRTNNPGSFYGSFCEGYGHFGVSEELCGETVEKVTISSSSRAIFIMRFIFTFMNIIRPTYPLFL